MSSQHIHLRKHIKKSGTGEDFCYACGLGGALIECECCPKAYHAVCLGDINSVESEFFQCPWHTCNVCNTNNAKYVDQISIVCTKCPTSYCPACVPEKVAKRLRNSEVSQPTSALYDVNNQKIKNLMHRYHNGELCVDALRWCAGMLPAGSMAFVCEACENGNSRDTDESISKEIYQVSLTGGYDLYNKSSSPKEGEREWAASEQVTFTSTNEELFSRHIEAVIVKKQEDGTHVVTVLRRWTSARAAAEELQFGAKLLLNSADSYQRWRDEKDDSVVTGCNLVWCYAEDQELGPGFVGSLYYPSVEVRLQAQALEQGYSLPLCTFQCIQHAVCVMTLGHQEIYDAACAFKNGEVSKGYTFRFCDDPHIMRHTSSGRKGPAADGVQLWKKKMVRDRFVLQRLKDFVNRERKMKKDLSVNAGLSKQDGIPNSVVVDLTGQNDVEEKKSNDGQKLDEEQKSTDDDVEKIDALSLVRSASQGTLAASSTSQSPRSTAGGSPRDGSLSSSAARVSILQTPSGPFKDSISQRSEISSLEEMFKSRKNPVIGPMYQVPLDSIPEVRMPPNSATSSERGVGLLCEPRVKGNLTHEKLETLCRAQYLPGLIVKIHPPNPADSAHGDHRMSMMGVPVVPVVGMVISEITAPLTPDTTIRLYVDTLKVCTVPLRRVEAIAHEDALLELYSSNNQSMSRATSNVREIAKKHIEAQWTAEQISTYIRTLEKTKGNLLKTRTIITGGPSVSGSTHKQNSMHNYSTRKIANFSTPMKALVERYFKYSLCQECYCDQGDIDEACIPSLEELSAIKEQVIAVHKVAEKFLDSSAKNQEMTVENKDGSLSPDIDETENPGDVMEDTAFVEQEQEAVYREEKVKGVSEPLLLRPTLPEDLRGAGFDLSPLPVSLTEAESVSDKFNMKRKRTDI